MQSQGFFSWMAWTQPVAIFFIAIGLLLTAMTAWELLSPNVARQGALPFVTTRGDRLFIGLLVAAGINLVWTGVTDMTQWTAAIIGALCVAVLVRWG